MTYEEKKKFLESYGKIKMRCAYIDEVIARLKSERTRITPKLSDMPAGGGDDSRIQALTERLFAQEEKAKEEQIKATEKLCEIMDAVNFIEDTEEHCILGYYYILLHTPKETADRYHISESTFYKKLQKGIENLEL